MPPAISFPLYLTTMLVLTGAAGVLFLVAFVCPKKINLIGKGLDHWPAQPAKYPAQRCMLPSTYGRI